jgi:hypothetical protein
VLDSLLQGKFRLKPLQPETVWVTIPRELYRKDFSVDLDIDRISGDYASVAELKLYEVYPFLEREGRDVYLRSASLSTGCSSLRAQTRSIA